jgi:NADH-quinone oxidoreductase subunit E
MGCTVLRQRLESMLSVACGETTADGRFTLLPNVCLGACDRAPVLMIDRDLHGEVALSQLETLLERYA